MVATTVAMKVARFTTVAETVANKTIGLGHMHFARTVDSCGLAHTMFASLKGSYGFVHAGERNVNSTRKGGWQAQQLHHGRS